MNENFEFSGKIPGQELWFDEKERGKIVLI